MGILDTLKTVDDQPYKWKGIIYGHQGLGKTELASSFPNPVWIDFEESTETLRAIGRGDIVCERPKTMKRAEEVVEAVTGKNSPFETIVVDTVNTMQAKQLAEHMLERVRNNSSLDLDMPLQFDYRKSTNQLTRIVSALQEADKHIILLCQERSVYKKDSSPPELVAIRPDVTFRLSELLSQMTNNVFRLTIKPGLGSKPAIRVLQVNPTGKIEAKNRMGIREIFIEDPSFEKLYINHERKS